MKSSQMLGNMHLAALDERGEQRYYGVILVRILNRLEKIEQRIRRFAIGGRRNRVAGRHVRGFGC